MKWKYILLIGLIIISLLILALSEFLLRVEDKHPGEPRVSSSITRSRENNFFIAEYRPLKDSVRLSQYPVTVYFDSAFSERQWRKDTEPLYLFSKNVPTGAYTFLFYYRESLDTFAYLFNLIPLSNTFTDFHGRSSDCVTVTSNDRLADTIWFRVVERNSDTSLMWTNPVPGEIFGFVREGIHLRDTIIRYSIEGISAEGSEVIATYQQDTLRDAQWMIYGETGKTIIEYHWDSNGVIAVKERHYRYKTNLTSVQSDQDISLADSLNYIMNRNGQTTTTISKQDFENLYPIFTTHVPLINK